MSRFCTRKWEKTCLTIAVVASLLPLQKRALAQDNLASLRKGGCPAEASVIASREDNKALMQHLSIERLLRPACGIALEPIYFGEVFTNTRGGISTNDATQYEALLDLPVTLDFESLGLPPPGRFFLLAQNTHGRGLTEDFIGDTQVVSNIDSFDNIMQVSEYFTFRTSRLEFGVIC